jgi:broad specificity phosphatase PhoE
MQTAIYFVRHGKVYNPTDVWYGRLPRFGLSQEGKKQIEQTANFLKNERIDHIYTSPLLRAKQTSDIIKHQLSLPKLYFSKDLLEIQSSLQGNSFNSISKLDYDVFAGPGKDIKGETIEDVYNRSQQFIHKMIKKYPGKKIVAVSHGDLLMLVKANLTGLPIENASLRPGPEQYMQHGEVYKVTCDEHIALTGESIFKPKPI